MIELPPAVAGGRLNDRREMIALVAPNRAHHRELIDQSSDTREPVRHWNARVAVAREGSQARDHRTFHLRHVIAEADGIDHLPGPLVAFRVKGINVADATAHEKKDDRFGFGLIAPAQQRLLEPGILREFAVLCPHGAQRGSEESAAGLRDKAATVDAPAGIERLATHRRSPHV